MSMKGRRELVDLALAVDMDLEGLEFAANDAFAAGVSLEAFVQSVRALHGHPRPIVRAPMSLTDLIRQFESVIGAKWPARHPITDAPFVRVDRPERTQENRVVHVAPPLAPSRQVVVRYDDDDGTVLETRTLSESEYGEAVETYARTSAEWYRTGGLGFVVGPVRITGTFTCADGSWARGLWVGNDWAWLHASSRRGEPPA